MTISHQVRKAILASKISSAETVDFYEMFKSICTPENVLLKVWFESRVGFKGL